MTAETQNEQKTKLAIGDYDLLRGTFIPDDAQEIVQALFTTKINYHKLKNLSKLISTESKDDNQIDRITELKATQEKTTELLKHAKESGKSVRLKSTIIIELI